MSGLELLQIVSGVVFGNALTGWWIYSAWRVTKAEKIGKKPSEAPFIALIGMIVPPLIAGLGAWYLT